MSSLAIRKFKLSGPLISVMHANACWEPRMGHYLAKKRPGAADFSRNELDVKSCKNCESAGLACEACKGKSNCSWLRLTLEKARCREFMATSIMATDLPQQQRVEVVKQLNRSSVPEDVSQEFMAPWTEVLEGARDKDILSGDMGKLRESILSKLCSALRAQAPGEEADANLGQILVHARVSGDHDDSA